jgi:hypothetical protein
MQSTYIILTGYTKFKLNYKMLPIYSSKSFCNFIILTFILEIANRSVYNKYFVNIIQIHSIILGLPEFLHWEDMSVLGTLLSSSSKKIARKSLPFESHGPGNPNIQI